MEKKKREKAAKKAGKVPEKAEAKPMSQAERFRRASLVVDVAAMATFEQETKVRTVWLPERTLTPTSKLTCLGLQGGGSASGGGGGSSAGGESAFVARRQSVLAGTNRRASLLAGVSGMMGTAAGGGSEADMMAAAVAAADMEDSLADAGEAGGKVMGDVVGVLVRHSSLL